MHDLLDLLSGGDRRSVGEADRAVALVFESPELIDVLFQGLESSDAVLRMRCADVIEKVSGRRPEWLVPYKSRLLQEFSRIEQKEVRWHVAPLLARLPLSVGEEEAAMEILFGYMEDRSSIVRTMAMQALADIAVRSSSRRPEIVCRIGEWTAHGTPAMRARGRKLLERLAET